jgi:hypothetical protein
MPISHRGHGCARDGRPRSRWPPRGAIQGIGRRLALSGAPGCHVSLRPGSGDRRGLHRLAFLPCPGGRGGHRLITDASDSGRRQQPAAIRDSWRRWVPRARKHPRRNPARHTRRNHPPIRSDATARPARSGPTALRARLTHQRAATDVRTRRDTGTNDWSWAVAATSNAASDASADPASADPATHAAAHTATHAAAYATAHAAANATAHATADAAANAGTDGGWSTRGVHGRSGQRRRPAD